MNFLDKKGFSLAEVMVAAGILGIVSLGVLQLTKNQTKVQKRAETSFEINTISSLISQTLLNSAACSETLVVGTNIADGVSIDEIKNRKGNTLYNKVNRYGKNQVRINSIVIEGVTVVDNFGEAKLVVEFEKLSKILKGNKFIKKEFPLKVELDNSDNLIKCFSSTENAVVTAKEEACNSLNGNYDVATDNCNLSTYVATDPPSDNKAVSTQSLNDFFNDKVANVLDSKYAELVGDSLIGKLQSIADIETSAGVCIDGNCRTTFADQECAVGQVVKKINKDGTIDCQSAGGTPSITVYQCPNGTGGWNPGGAWGSYGCQGQISSRSTCKNIEYPNQQTRNCTLLGKILIQ